MAVGAAQTRANSLGTPAARHPRFKRIVTTGVYYLRLSLICVIELV